MSTDAIFRDRDDKKRILNKEIVRDSLFKEARFLLIQSIVAVLFLLGLCALLIFLAIRHPGIETIAAAAFLTFLTVFILCITIGRAKRCLALLHGKFSVVQDVLINIKPHEHTWLTRTDGVYRQEDVFFFESGIQFKHIRTTPTQKNLTYSATCGDVFYLVLLKDQPTKPVYIYNSQDFEYRE